MRPLAMALTLLAACTSASTSRTSSAPETPRSSASLRALRFGLLLDGRGGAIQNAVVVVEGDRITRIGEGDAGVPAGATVVDLRPLTAIPGLIDAHTHMTYYWDRQAGTQPWAQQGRRLGAMTV